MNSNIEEQEISYSWMKFILSMDAGKWVSYAKYCLYKHSIQFVSFNNSMLWKSSII